MVLIPGQPLTADDLARCRQLAADRVAVDPDDPLAQAAFRLADEVDRLAGDISAIRVMIAALGQPPPDDGGPWRAGTLIGLGVAIGAAVLFPFALGVV